MPFTYVIFCRQCFDTVGWASKRSSSLEKGLLCAIIFGNCPISFLTTRQMTEWQLAVYFCNESKRVITVFCKLPITNTRALRPMDTCRQLPYLRPVLSATKSAVITVTSFSLLRHSHLRPGQSWTWVGCIHGLDWIGLGWIGLGRMLEKLGWIGLHWIAANGWCNFML